MPDQRLRLVGFLCNWCSYAGADHAGGLRLPYSADLRLVRVMCSGRVDPQFILAAFREGADGVMVLGCHPGDCHYRNGNVKALRRIRILEAMLPQFGIDAGRVHLDWVGAGEGEKFQRVATEMVERVELLGPLGLPGFLGVRAGTASGFDGSSIPPTCVAPRRLPARLSSSSRHAGLAHQRSLSDEGVPARAPTREEAV